MAKSGNEERYPLLLLYVEENGRKSEFPQRVVFADKGRGEVLVRGAANIVTLWPAQVTSCWLTSVALGTAFILLSLLLLMSSINPLSFPIHPRCTRDLHDQKGNKSIHLVKHGVNWDHKQLDILRFIADTYPDFQIRVIVLETSFKNFKNKKVTEKPAYRFHVNDITNSLVKKWNEILKNDHGSYETTTKLTVNLTKGKEIINKTLKRDKRNIHYYKLPLPNTSYEDIMKIYPNIIEEHHTFKEYFSGTPLHYFWIDYTSDMIIFSVRVLELWQNGGISFFIPCHNHTQKHTIKPSNKTSNSTQADVDISRLKVLIASTKFRYEKLNDDLVSIDGQGYHMATKTPCHSFFGEMIIKLQKDIFNMKVYEFIQRILNVFCGRGAVDSEYCNKK